MMLLAASSVVRLRKPPGRKLGRFFGWCWFVYRGMTGKMGKMHWRGPGFIAPRPACGIDPRGSETTKFESQVTCVHCQRVLEKLEHERTNVAVQP